MRLLLASALAAVVVALNAHAQVPIGPASIKLGKAQPAVLKTPEYQVSGVTKRSGPAKDWLELEVSFDTVPEVIDELTFKYTVLLEKKLLTGEVTHVNIAKGKDHFSVMYVSPRAIERLTGGKSLTAASIENVWVEVLRSGQSLGKTSFKPGVPPNAPQISDMLLNKDQTPYAPLFYDRYEAIKPAK